MANNRPSQIMMAITRKLTIEDLSPRELAEFFCEMFGAQQAAFFDEVADISKDWPGMGWCGQSLDIANNLTPPARDVIAKLSAHALANEESA